MQETLRKLPKGNCLEGYSSLADSSSSLPHSSLPANEEPMTQKQDAPDQNEDTDDKTIEDAKLNKVDDAEMLVQTPTVRLAERQRLVERQLAERHGLMKEFDDSLGRAKRCD